MAQAAAYTGWQRLGAQDPKTLGESRLELHHAAQIIVSAAISYLPAKSDDSHTNLEWLPDVQSLATNVLHPTPLRFAVRPADLTLLAITGDATRASFHLTGHRVDEAVAWMRGEVARDGFDPQRLTTKKHYAIPPHPVATGAAWAGDRTTLGELSHYYHDAWVVATRVASATPGASDVRCWPHHFDIATLIPVDTAADGTSRTIGFGMSPGDESYPEPYFYASPYPYPPEERRPTTIAVGHWHSTGFFAAVLSASELLAAPGTGQEDTVMRFATAAIAACRAAMGNA